jgi:hypothetical protein
MNQVEWTESDYSRDTAMRFARAGALVRIVCADDACEVCQARARQVYLPSDAPRLPIRGCLHETCRCRFVAVDPQSELSVPELIERAMTAIKAGREDLARPLLRRAVALDEMSEQGWLWLSAVVEDQAKVACLEQVLVINPHNRHARAGLDALLKRRRAPASSVPPQEPKPETAPAPAIREEPPPTLESMPGEVLDIREERKVIVEQWIDFTQIAAETDPQMFQIQGRAFLKKLQDLGEQVLDMLPPGMQADELQVQWQEAAEVGEALGNLALQHPGGASGDSEMSKAIRSLARQVFDYRSRLRARILTTGR